MLIHDDINVTSDPMHIMLFSVMKLHDVSLNYCLHYAAAHSLLESVISARNVDCSLSHCDPEYFLSELFSLDELLYIRALTILLRVSIN